MVSFMYFRHFLPLEGEDSRWGDVVIHSHHLNPIHKGGISEKLYHLGIIFQNGIVSNSKQLK